MLKYQRLDRIEIIRGIRMKRNNVGGLLFYFKRKRYYIYT